MLTNSETEFSPFGNKNSANNYNTEHKPKLFISKEKATLKTIRINWNLYMQAFIV